MFSGWWNLFRLGSYPLCGTFGVRISKRGSAVLLHKIRRVSYDIDERFQLSLSRFFSINTVETITRIVNLSRAHFWRGLNVI